MAGVCRCTESATDAALVFVRSVTQSFYIEAGNATITSVNGVKLGARPLQNTYTGFNLPYGQKVEKFGYDNSTLYVHAGTTSTGQALVLAAIPQPDGSAAVKPVLSTRTGVSFLECEVIATELFCVSEPNGINQNDFTPTDYNGDGHYELAIDRSRSELVSLYVLAE